MCRKLRDDVKLKYLELVLPRLVFHNAGEEVVAKSFLALQFIAIGVLAGRVAMCVISTPSNALKDAGAAAPVNIVGIELTFSRTRDWSKQLGCVVLSWSLSGQLRKHQWQNSMLTVDF